jgi:branched-chain amino acid transport system ATP-binding protein
MSRLVIRDLHAHYGKSHILQGVQFNVDQGSIASILGRNGSGRSTTLKSIMGIVTPSRGEILLDEVDLAGLTPNQIAHHGVAYVPEDRQIFPNLTVAENLQIGIQSPRAGAPTWTIADVHGFFPRLKERMKQQSGTMSGGEQQMLTLCRSLLGNPKFLLVDEPTEGLAPLIVEALKSALIEIARRGVAILLVEQKLSLALHISGKVLVMGHGQIAFSGPVSDFVERRDVRRAWLDVSF